jgi:hypothetical protein
MCGRTNARTEQRNTTDLLNKRGRTKGETRNKTDTVALRRWSAEVCLD